MHIPYIFPSSLYIPYSMGSGSELLGVSQPSKSWIHSAFLNGRILHCTFFAPLPGRSIWACPLWATAAGSDLVSLDFLFRRQDCHQNHQTQAAKHDESPSKKRWFCEVEVGSPKIKMKLTSLMRPGISGLKTVMLLQKSGGFSAAFRMLKHWSC